MADSPKCKECAAKGIVAQTYRVARTQTFKCHGCKKVFPMSYFENADFLWKKLESV